MNITKNFFIKSLFTMFLTLTAGMAAVHAATTDAKPAGTVTFATGDASIVRADKSIVKAAKNDALNAGDTIDTKNGRLQLALIDGGKVSLQPNTIYKINKYEFSGKEDGSEYAFTELVKGGLRTVSGLIGHKNRDRYQLKTAVATIGIRGTEFTVNLYDNQFLMTTNHGSVDVCNASGCLNAVTGQSIAVAGVGAAPKPSGKAAKAAAAAPGSNRAVFSVGDDLVIEPAVTQTLANYNGDGTLVSVMKTSNGNGFDGVASANIVTSASTAPVSIDTSGNIAILPSSFSSINNDGIIGWGRYNAGTITTPGFSGGGATSPATIDVIQWADYAIGKTPDATQLATLSGTYTVFGSTAPMLVKSSGNSIEIGAENKVIGSLNFNFGNAAYTHTLKVQTVGADYFINGGGNLITGNPNFYSSDAQSIVTGGACNTGACSGALASGNVLQGSFIGTNAERIGLQYGINIPGSGVSGGGGQVFGTAVLK